MFFGNPSKEELKQEIRRLYLILEEDVRCPSLDSDIPKALGIRKTPGRRGTATFSAQLCFNMLYQLSLGRNYDGSSRTRTNYEKTVRIAISALLESLKFTLAAPHFDGRTDKKLSDDVDDFVGIYWYILAELVDAAVFCEKSLLDKKQKEIREYISGARKGLNHLLEQDYDPEYDNEY